MLDLWSWEKDDRGCGEELWAAHDGVQGAEGGKGEWEGVVHLDAVGGVQVDAEEGVVAVY